MNMKNHSLEWIVDEQGDGGDLDGILSIKPLEEPLSSKEKIAAIRRDIDRIEGKKAQAYKSGRLPMVLIYEGHLSAKQRELAETLDGDPGEPPHRHDDFLFGAPGYRKEIQDIERYFSISDRLAVLKTQQDLVHAALGVRLLNMTGKVLDNYEVGIPADYRLELLKRAGRYCEAANLFQRIMKGDVNLHEFQEQVMNGFLFRVTTTPPDKSFGRGFERPDDKFVDLFGHVYEYNYRMGDSYVSTTKSLGSIKDTWFRPREQGGFGRTPDDLRRRPLYVYVINPRAMLGLDVENSPETYMNVLSKIDPGGILPRNTAFVQKEVAVCGKIDPRDIKCAFKLGYGGREIKLQDLRKNNAYPMSDWELPGA